MAKPVITTITGQANNNAYQNNKANDELAEAIALNLPKDGSEPLLGDLDLNGYDIVNVGSIEAEGGGYEDHYDAQATAPTENLFAGYLWMDTSTDPYVLKTYDGSSWDIVNEAETPSGEGSIVTAANVTAMKALTETSDGDIIYLEGHTSEGDGGQGFFRLDVGDTSSTDDNGTVFTPDTLTGRFKRIFNGTAVDVRWFGITGTNDQVAFTNAANNHETVVIPKGVTVALDNYTLDSGDALRLLQIEGVLFAMSSGTTALFTNNAVDSVVIKGSGTLDGNGDNRATSAKDAVLIRLDGTDDCLVEGITIEGNSTNSEVTGTFAAATSSTITGATWTDYNFSVGDSISLRGFTTSANNLDSTLITNITTTTLTISGTLTPEAGSGDEVIRLLTGNYGAISTLGSNRVKVKNIKCYNSRGDGVYFNGGFDCTVEDSTFRVINGTAIGSTWKMTDSDSSTEIETQGARHRFINNFCFQTANSAVSCNSPYSIVSNNNIFSVASGYSGIAMGHDSTDNNSSTEYSICDSNIIKTVGLDGISVTNAPFIKVSDNNISDFDRNGIAIQYEATATNGNTTDGNVTGNVIDGGGTGIRGILHNDVTGPRMSYIGNTIRGCATGMSLSEDSTYTARYDVVTDNNISNCTNGIYTVNYYRNTITGNTISDCQYGFRFIGNGGRNTESNNTISATTAKTRDAAFYPNVMLIPNYTASSVTYFWVDSTGDLRVSSNLPDAVGEASDGVVVGTQS